MNGDHVVGYVGGLAVALGVGAAVWAGMPTASADSSSASHGPSSGTAKSARPSHHTNAVGATKPTPARKVDAPTSSVTLLVAVSGTGDTRRTTPGALRPPAAANVAAAAPTAPHDLSLAYDPVTDMTSVTVVDTGTNSPVGSTVTIDGSAGTPVLSSDRKRALITTTDYNPVTDQYDAGAVVMNMTAGGQIGNTFGFSDASPMSASFAPDGTRAVVTLFLTSTSRIWVATLDTTTGTQTGIVDLGGYPFVAPVWNADGTRVLITLSQLGGETTEVTVLDATTGDVAGQTIPIQGYAKRAPIMTASGTRAVVTTVVDSNSGPSTRVTVVNTTAGWTVGNPLKVPGTAKISLLGDGQIALVTTGSGLLSILNTHSADATQPLPLLPPFGLDPASLFRSPLGVVLLPATLLVGYFGVIIVTFYVLPAILVVPAWIAEFVRQFPPITISTPW